MGNIEIVSAYNHTHVNTRFSPFPVWWGLGFVFFLSCVSFPGERGVVLPGDEKL